MLIKLLLVTSLTLTPILANADNHYIFVLGKNLQSTLSENCTGLKDASGNLIPGKGWIVHDSTDDFYISSDTGCHVHIYNDGGQGTGGFPQVVFDTTGCSEIDGMAGNTAWLVNPNDPDEKNITTQPHCANGAF